MDKNQFDEVLINALYLLGGANETPFKDIIFFEEEKDISEEIENKTMRSLDYYDEDDYLDSYDDMIVDYEDLNELVDDIKSKIDVDKIAEDVMDRLSKKIISSDMIPKDLPIIILDPNIYKDLDVNKFDLTLGSLTELADDDLNRISILKKDIENINIQMLDRIKSKIKIKSLYLELHKEKNKKIEDLYNIICDKKTEEIENIMNDFCKYVISSEYCKNKTSIITLIASTTVYVKNFMIKSLDDIFKPIIVKAGNDTDIVLMLLTTLN